MRKEADTEGNQDNNEKISIKFEFRLKKISNCFICELTLNESSSTNRELLNQILQFLKNKTSNKL